MPKELIGLTVVAAYAAFVLLLFRWMRSRLFKRARAAAETLEKAGGRILAVHPSPGFRQPAQVEFELDGKKARFQVRQYSRDFILQSIRLESAPLPAILVRAERTLDRLGKSLGLDHEVQLGDATFDDAAYIESSASEAVVRRALGPEQVRAHVLDLLRLGYRLDMSSDGLGASRIHSFYGGFEAAELPEVMRVLELIQAGLPRFEPSDASVPSPQYRGFLIGFGAIVVGIATFPLMRFVHPPMDDLDSLKVLGLGLVAWLVVMLGLSRLFRKQPNGMASLLVAGLFLIFAVPPIFAFTVFALNSGLDGGAVTTRRAPIVYLSPREHEVFIPPSRPERIRDKVGTKGELYRTLKVGDTIEIDTRPGALGWAWVTGVRRVP